VVACPSGNGDVTSTKSRAMKHYAPLSAVSTETGDHLQYTVLVCNLPLRPTQPPTSSGREMSTGQGAAAALYGREGNWRSDISLAMRHRLCYIHVQAEWPKEGRLTPCLHSPNKYGTTEVQRLKVSLKGPLFNLTQGWIMVPPGHKA